MYLEHFGLRELPFTLTPNTAFFYARGSHCDAFDTLRVAIRSGEGFVKVTGEVGTGKTLLCRRLLDDLERDFVTAFIPDPSLRPAALRRVVAEELGVEVGRPSSDHHLVRQLTESLVESHAAGRGAVVLIDEAQTMSRDALEAVRLLTNVETERFKLLQVVLFGQPELDARLAEPGLRQLRQRLSFSCRLKPLTRAQVGEYLDFRLQQAGHRGAPLFTGWAARRIARASRGVPRLINILAHKALLAAYGESARAVTWRHVGRAVADTEEAGAGWPRAWATGALVAAVVATGLALTFGVSLIV